MRSILSLASLFLRGTALMFALVAVTTGLGCLGGVVSDRLDGLTHFAPIWLACAAAGLLLGAAFARETERRAIVGLSLTAIVALGVLMAPELLAALGQKTRAPMATTLKLVQFNVWADNHDPDATAAWILAQNADVVMIEEGSAASRPVVLRLRETYPTYVACGRGCDTWIFSRWPVVARGRFSQPDQPLSGGWATLRHPSGAFTVAATHFGWPIPAGPQQAQSRRLVASLERFPRDTLIVSGDFNSTPWSWSLRRQDKALGLERRTRALASWPGGAFSRVASAPFPLLPIDHVYAGKAWKTVKVERGPVLGSDHRPVVVTLTR